MFSRVAELRGAKDANQEGNGAQAQDRVGGRKRHAENSWTTSSCKQGAGGVEKLADVGAGQGLRPLLRVQGPAGGHRDSNRRARTISKLLRHSPAGDLALALFAGCQRYTLSCRQHLSRAGIVLSCSSRMDDRETRWVASVVPPLRSRDTNTVLPPSPDHSTSQSCGCGGWRMQRVSHSN